VVHVKVCGVRYVSAWWECEGVWCEGCEYSVSVSVRGVCGAEFVSVVYSGTN